MKLKPTKWRKVVDYASGLECEQATIGLFTLSSDSIMWGVYCELRGQYNEALTWQTCRSVEDGKRKAEAWWNKQLRGVV